MNRIMLAFKVFLVGVVFLGFSSCVYITTKVEVEIANPLKKAVACHTSAETCWYLDRAVYQLQSRGWDEETAIVQGIATNLREQSISLERSQDQIDTLVNEMQGTDMGPQISGGELLAKYRHGYAITIIVLVAMVILVVTHPTTIQDIKQRVQS